MAGSRLASAFLALIDARAEVVLLVATLLIAAGAGNQVVCKGTVCYDHSPQQTRHSATDRISSAQCPAPRVVDGDTLRCGSERVRLLGIDAPELEHCPRWRVCAPGDGQASKRSLVAAMRSGPVRLQRVTVDRYGRTVAVVWAGGVNLSCWQLERGQAIYKPHWDNGGRIAAACR